MASSGAVDSPTLTLPSPAVPSAGLEAQFGVLAEISPSQVDQRSPLRVKGACGWAVLGGWYAGLGYGCLTAAGGRKLSAWTVRSSQIGCS